MSSPDFLVKLPVVENLEGGHRGLIIFAQVLDPFTIRCVMFRSDGQTVSLNMPAGRFQALSKNGPFVVLTEVKNVGAPGNLPSVGVLGPDGRPVS